MKPEDLQIGHLYRLTQTVENPIVDRRSANPMLKLTELKEGTYFVCMCSDDHPDLIQLKHGSYRTHQGVFTVGVREADGSVRPSKYESNETWTNAVLPHLERVPIDSWDLVTRAFGFHSMSTVLHELFDDGTIPLERLLELLRKHTIGMGSL